MKTVKIANDLVTNRLARVKGFSWQASEKVSRSSGFIGLAKYFTEKAPIIDSIKSVRADAKLTEFVIAACMLSKKSLSHLDETIQDEIIENLIDFKKLKNEEYVKSLEQRYFLTSGDSLGGSMRNAIGQAAQTRLTETIIAKLEAQGDSPKRVVNPSGKTTAIIWPDRRVIFDKKPSFIGKSIDIIVVRGSSAKSGNIEKASDYVCCGELKGGIDPAGADEHWKTAKTALDRIHGSFTDGRGPNLVFLGSAIEQSMAEEIFALMGSGWLTGACNINYANQFNEMIDIIVS
jgi:type II restriction enzyme